MYTKYIAEDSSESINFWNLDDSNYTIIECTVKAFISSGDGKYPSEGFTNLIIINDYTNYMPRLYEGSSFGSDIVIPQGWVNYITQTPNISDQYANIMVGTLPGQRYEYYTNSDFE